MVKKNMHKTAAAFRKEANVCGTPVGSTFADQMPLLYAYLFSLNECTVAMENEILMCVARELLSQFGWLYW